MDKFNQFSTQMAALRSQMEQQAQSVVDGVLKEIFDNNPQLKAITWEQFTGYFCDGDPCEFGIWDPDIHWEGPVDQIWCYRGSDDQRAHPELCEAQKEIANIFTDEAFQELAKMSFGDHMRIEVTRTEDREGIVIEDDEYTDHD
jgi:uncharacterized protein (UPF0297 family)